MGITYVIPTIVLLAAGIYLLVKKRFVNAGRILILFCIVEVTVFSVLFGILAAAFSTVHAEFYAIIFLILGILAIIFSACALWGVLKKKHVYIPLCVSILLCALSIGGVSLYQSYIDRIPTIDESKNMLAEYAPYAEGSKVAELGEASDLILEGDLPKMNGATALYPIYSAFAKAVYPKEVLENIARKDPERDLYHFQDNEYLQCDTTTWAYKKIVSGEADIVFVGGPSEEQEQFAKDSGVELIYTPIGKEAFVFFVNSKNPIDDLTLEQIQDIYSGKITEWGALGAGGLGKIQAFQRDEGSGSQSALVRMMEGKELMTPPQEDVINGMGGIISQTADYKNFKNAIGYSFRFYATEMVQNDQIKLLSINGIAPDIENIENGTYPIASEFYAVTRSDMSENTQKLLDWIVSEQGQKLIALTGYTALN